MSIASFQRLLSRAIVPALAVCLFGIVLGLKWATFTRFGSPMPDWDQWDAEAMKLLVPWFEDDRFVAQLFEPHNEHRVVVTKLQNFALTLGGGQWDARVQAVANAVVHSVIAVAFWCVAVAWLRRPATEANPEAERRSHFGFLSAALFVLVVALFGLPTAWQNVLGGFHSQQYWLLGLSFAAIVALPFARPGSLAWGAATAAAALALLTMGSGLLAAAVVFGVVSWRWWRGDTDLRTAWPTLAVTVLFMGVGLATRVEVPYHAELKAQNGHDFVFSILRSLEWPLWEQDWAGPLLWIPWLLVAAQAVRRGATRAALTLAALGGWVLVQIVATAYARGAGAGYPASRYMDTLVFGTAVNGAALGWLLGQPAARRAVRLARGGLALLWTALVAIGLYPLVGYSIATDMPLARAYYDKAETHMLAFLTTDDPAHLAFPDIPYPGADALIDRLSHRCLRERMPAEIRPALPVAPARLDAAANAIFTANIASALAMDTAPRHGLSPATPALATRSTWGSFNDRGGRNTGQWRSAPLTASVGGWLKFEIAGDLGGVDDALLSLVLRDAATGAELARVRPTRMPGNAWRSTYVRAPRQSFIIEASDHSAACWFAFSAPVEMSRLSYATWRVAKHGLLIAEIAGGVALALAVALALVARRRHGPST